MEKKNLNVVILLGQDQPLVNEIAMHLVATQKLRHIKFLDMARREVADAWQFDVELFNSTTWQQTKDLRFSVAACNFTPFVNAYIDTHQYEHSTTVQRSPVELIDFWLSYRLEQDAEYWFKKFDEMFLSDEFSAVLAGKEFPYKGYVITEIAIHKEIQHIARLSGLVENQYVQFTVLPPVYAYSGCKDWSATLRRLCEAEVLHDGDIFSTVLAVKQSLRYLLDHFK